MPEPRFQFARAVLKNALLWGVLCGTAGGGLAALLTLFDPGPGVESLPERLGMALFAGASWGVRFGIWGGLVGLLFALAIRIGFRGRRLADLSPLRFALLGAIVGGVGVPLGLQLMNVAFGGGPIAWHLVLDDGIWASIFGATAGAGSIWLARRAATLPTESGQDLLEGPDPFEGVEQGREKVMERSPKG